MSDSKPILFIGPLSEALIKLKGDIEAIKESENLELYEMDQLNEVNQVLPTLGTSFSILSSPKKCAQMLQINKNYIKANKLKIILLSPKALPPKIIQRLEKLGLTECVVEPVPQKTLFYKAKIHIKSIKIFKQKIERDEHLGSSDVDLGGMEEQEVKSIKNNDINFDDDLYGNKNDKIGHASLNEQNEEIEEDRTSGLLDELNSLKEELAEERNKLDEDFENLSISSMPQENLSDLKGDIHEAKESLGNLKGKSNFKEEAKSPLIGKSNYKEENKSNLAGKSNFKDSESGNLEGDLDGGNKETSNLSGQSNFKEEDKSPLAGKSNFKEENKGNLKGSLEKQNQIDGNLKGDLSGENKGQNDLKGKSNFQEEAKSPLAGKTDFKENEKSPLAGKTNFKEVNKGDLKGSIDKQNKLDGNLTGDQGQRSDQLSNLKGKSNTQNTSQPGMLKGKITKQEKKQEEKPGLSPLERMKLEKEERERNAPKDKLEKDDTNENLDSEGLKESLKNNTTGSDPNKDLQNENKKSTLLEKENLNLEDDEEKNKEPLLNHENLNLEKDELSNKEELSQEEENSPLSEREKKRIDIKDKLASLEENYEEKKDDIKTEQAWRPNKELKKEEKLDSSTDFKQLEKKDKNKDSNSPDQLKDDLGYDLDNERSSSGNSSIELEEEISKSSGSLKYAQKGDLGEQTIDYKKLKAGEEGIFEDRKGENAQDGILDDITREKETHYRRMGKDSPESNDQSKENKGNGADYTQKIIEAEPNGLDNLVEVFSFYFDKNKSSNEIFEHINSKLNSYYPCKILVIQRINKKEEEQIYQAGFEKQELKNLTNNKREQWESKAIPEWSDPSFSATDNSFFFPLYTGVTPLGYSYIEFLEKVNEKHAINIEVTLEGLRGIYLEMLDKLNGKTYGKKKLNLNPFKRGA